MTLTRRSLVRRALVAFGLSPAGLSACAGYRPRATAPPAEDPSDRPATLSDAEVDDLVALGEAIVEGRTLVADRRRDLTDYIRDRARRSRGQLALYRTALATLHGPGARRLASLGIDERTALLAHHGLAGRIERPHGELARVVADLVRGYYTSPAGWAVVGYETFPGRCGELTRYTRAER